MMNFQRVSALVRKDLKKIVRDPALLFLIIMFPVVLTIAFGFSFGAIGGTQSSTYQVGLVNMNAGGAQEQWSQYFVGNLSAIELLNIQAYSDNATAQADLVQGRIQAIVLIPANFGESCSSFLEAPNEPSSWVNASLPIYLDSGSMFATQAIPPLVQQVLVTTILGEKPTGVSLPIQLSTPSLIQTSKFTMFDYMVPGLFAYASIFLTMTVAQSFTTEREEGLLRRINTTPTSPTEFMFSQTVSNMIIAFVQALVVFVMAYVVGYRPSVSLESLVLAFTVVLVFSLCNVGFGLITATVAKSSGAATGLSFIFILPQMFLGTFVGFALSGSAQAAGRFVPSYYVTDALTSLFLRSAPITSPSVLLDLAVVSIASLTALLLGIILFRKYGKA